MLEIKRFKHNHSIFKIVATAQRINMTMQEPDTGPAAGRAPPSTRRIST